MPKKTIKKKPEENQLQGIEKTLTGIAGFDEITYGGIPQGRPTLICGNTGCGKTLTALEIIVRGAVKFNEPGVFVALEETKEDLIKNVASLGFDLAEPERKKLLYIEYIHVDVGGLTSTGPYDLEALFIRIDNSINKIGAKRIAIDTLEVLFSGFTNHYILRSELRRLFQWLKEKNLTTIVTGESGDGGAQLTRHGMEEYVADCVVFLTSRKSQEIFTRRLQIIKYRGSYHETNEFPFLITRHGISVLPITSPSMGAKASRTRITSGIPELDQVLDGQGFYEGSSILLSGASGTGKTTFGATFANSICKANKRCLFFSYEESEDEILRNTSSVGLELKKHVDQGLLKIISSRPTQKGLEKHLESFIGEVDTFEPAAVVIDPISTLNHCGSEQQVYSVLMRMIDFLKNKKITLFSTILFVADTGKQEFSFGISSIIDAWIVVRDEEANGELTRSLLVVKSRGMDHSNQVREFGMTKQGLFIKEPYFGESGVLTGTARLVQEHKDKVETAENLNKIEKLHNELNLKRQLIESQIESLNAEFEAKKIEAENEEQLLLKKEEIHVDITKALKNARSSKIMTPTKKEAKNVK